jgi:hypothetical protein
MLLPVWTITAGTEDADTIHIGLRRIRVIRGVRIDARACWSEALVDHVCRGGGPCKGGGTHRVRAFRLCFPCGPARARRISPESETVPWSFVLPRFAQTTYVGTGTPIQGGVAIVVSKPLPPTCSEASAGSSRDEPAPMDSIPCVVGEKPWLRMT